MGGFGPSGDSRRVGRADRRGRVVRAGSARDFIRAPITGKESVRMLTRRRDATTAATVAGLALWMAGPAAAQDSTAPAALSSGDALDAYALGAGGQIADYVVDLAPITSSWGGRYAIGPLIKS